MTLVVDIMKTIADPVSKLATWLKENHQVPSEDTISKWKELTGMCIAGDDDQTNISSTVEVKSKKKIPKTKDVCKHIFISGQRTGEQCSIKPKGASEYCSAHRPKDGVQPKANKAGKMDKIDPIYATDTEAEADEDQPKKTKSKKEIKPKSKNKASKNPSTDYVTDEEKLDHDLNLSDNE